MDDLQSSASPVDKHSRKPKRGKRMESGGALETVDSPERPERALTKTVIPDATLVRPNETPAVPDRAGIAKALADAAALPAPELRAALDAVPSADRLALLSALADSLKAAASGRME